jgi:hypothetical protein
MRNEVGQMWYQSIGLISSFSHCEMPQTISSDACFSYLNTIIVHKHGISIGLRHNFAHNMYIY